MASMSAYVIVVDWQQNVGILKPSLVVLFVSVAPSRLCPSPRLHTGARGNLFPTCRLESLRGKAGCELEVSAGGSRGQPRRCSLSPRWRSLLFSLYCKKSRSSRQFVKVDLISRRVDALGEALGSNAADWRRPEEHCFEATVPC